MLIVTLSAEDNVKLLKSKLSEGFKRTVYWNEYKAIDNKTVEYANNNEEKYIREFLDSSCQGFKKLVFLLIIIKKAIIKFLVIHIKNIFFQELK